MFVLCNFVHENNIVLTIHQPGRTCALRTKNDEISVMKKHQSSKIDVYVVVLEESNAQTSPEFFFLLGLKNRRESVLE